MSFGDFGLKEAYSWTIIICNRFLQLSLIGYSRKDNAPPTLDVWSSKEKRGTGHRGTLFPGENKLEFQGKMGKRTLTTIFQEENKPEFQGKIKKRTLRNHSRKKLTRNSEGKRRQRVEEQYFTKKIRNLEKIPMHAFIHFS